MAIVTPIHALETLTVGKFTFIDLDTIAWEKEWAVNADAEHLDTDNPAELALMNSMYTQLRHELHVIKLIKARKPRPAISPATPANTSEIPF